MTQLALDLSRIKRTWLDAAAPVVLDQMRGKQFCADDVHGIVPEPDNVNLFGVLMASLSSRGLITRVGSKPSQRKERNGAYVGIYEVSNERAEP